VGKAKDRRKKDAQLTKNIGVNHNQAKDVLSLWKKKNKTSVNSVEEFSAALGEVGFWNNFESKGLGAEEFKRISKRCPNLKKELATELFHIFDKDHDGQVSAKEFMTGILESKTSDPKKQAELLFEAWDEDNSGTLSKDEIKKLWMTRRSSDIVLDSYMLRTMYHDMGLKINMGYLGIFPDLTRSNLEVFVSQTASKAAKEIMNIVRATEKLQIDKIVDTIFEKADTDKNGTLSKEEFVTFFSDKATVDDISSNSAENEKVDLLFEKVAHDMMYLFLMSSKDENAKKCAQFLKDSMSPDEVPVPEVPIEILEKVVAATSAVEL